MANAIKKISVQRGYDVTRYALNCFGGAGGQHACLVADALGMTSVLIHPFSSLLSAYGMGLADIRSVRQQAIEEPFGETARGTLARVARKLAREVTEEVAGQGVATVKIKVQVRAHLRYAGTDTALIVEAGKRYPPLQRKVELAALQKMKSSFERAHKAQFGFIDRSKSLVVEAVSVEAVGGGATFNERAQRTQRAKLPVPARRTKFFSGGKWRRANVYTRDRLTPGQKLPGPAIIIEPHQTVVVEEGWRAELTAKNHLLLRRSKKLARAKAIGTSADPVMLEVFNNLFMSIAEQMGVALQNTAYSVNIKERLDFSCAVFDGNGSLVANAPHMPVHLGSMDRAVETIIRENQGKIRPGDVYAINAPYNGGTHLPDITVCTPVFDGRKIRFWVASRGHHADVGGISPGSMSPNATTIEQEGVYIDNFKLVDRGRFREKELRALLVGGKYPARNPLQNINDLKAQIAANEKGVQELGKMVRHFTLPVVHAYMRHVQDNAAESVRRVIDRLHDSAFAVEMDQGAIIKVRISVDKKRRKATVDFTGTSPQLPVEFQRTRAGDARRRTLRVPRHGRRRHSDECRLLAPDPHRHSEAIDAVAGVSCRRRRRQCRDLPGGDQLPVRRARRHGGGAGHHEQPQFRQCALSILRDDLFRLAGGARLSRHRRGAHSHDQHAAHRPGNPGATLSGAARGLPHPQRLGRTRPMERRRRHQPHHPFPRKNGMHHPVRPSPRAPVRPRRRRRRRNRRELGAAPGRTHGEARRLRRDRDRRRRSDHHPDADCGRLRRTAAPARVIAAARRCSSNALEHTSGSRFAFVRLENRRAKDAQG